MFNRFKYLLVIFLALLSCTKDVIDNNKLNRKFIYQNTTDSKIEIISFNNQNSENKDIQVVTKYKLDKNISFQQEENNSQNRDYIFYSDSVKVYKDSVLMVKFYKNNLDKIYKLNEYKYSIINDVHIYTFTFD